MSDATKAVFLSYASQDAEAARRIAEALRAAGVEVWFDQSELVGGDAWDAKIRRHIKECTLLIPVISAATQARTEGYFRLEWKLAEDRSHLMAKGHPFILPVCVDGTTERGALVPDAFLAVQWTRLPLQPIRQAHDGPAQGFQPGAEATQAFVAQVKRLLSMEQPPSSRLRGITASQGGGGGGGREQGHLHPAQRDGGVASPAKAGRRVPAAAWLLALAVIVIALGLVWWRKPAAEPNAGAGTRPPTSEKPAALAAAPAATDKSIAVLPFTNMSEDKDANAFFSDGIHEDILTNLAHIRELRVVSRTSVMEYRGTTKRIPQIARELHVAYVLEGSVRRAGNKVRVTGQLIRAGTDEHVWAQSYDRDLTDIFAIQAELAQAIAGELDATLSPREERLLTSRPTENSAAYDFLLKARAAHHVPSFIVRDDGQQYLDREALLRSALELDPKFALAWAELAVADAQMIAASVDPTPARLAKAKAAVDQANALAPGSPDVIRAWGAYYLFGLRDPARGREQFAKLVQLQPNDAESWNWLGTAQLLQGQWADVIATQRKVTALDPRNIDYSTTLQLTYLLVRRFDDAAAELRRSMMGRERKLVDETQLAVIAFLTTGSHREMDELALRVEQDDPKAPWLVQRRKNRALQRHDYAEFLRLDREEPRGDNFGANLDVDMARAVCVMLLQGDTAGARARLGDSPTKLRAKLELEPDNTQLLRQAALIEACLGHRDDALRFIEHAVELEPESKNARTGAGIAMVRAHVYAWLGDKDQAIAELTRLLQIPGTLNVHRMKMDPLWAPLYGDPRFEALLNDPKNNAPLF